MVRYKIVSQFSVWHKSLCKAPEHNSLVCTPLLPTREVGWLIPSQSGVWLWSPQNRTSTGELLREDPIWALLTKTCLGPVPTLRAAPEIRAPCTFPAELLPAHLASLWKLGKGIPSSRWMQPWARAPGLASRGQMSAQPAYITTPCTRLGAPRFLCTLGIPPTMDAPPRSLLRHQILRSLGSTNYATLYSFAGESVSPTKLWAFYEALNR